MYRWDITGSRNNEEIIIYPIDVSNGTINERTTVCRVGV